LTKISRQERLRHFILGDNGSIDQYYIVDVLALYFKV
jgi:hypothetical protein